MRAGWMKTMFGQPDDAFGCFERALALSPYDPFTFNVYFGMAAAHGERHEYREASALVEKGLRAGPGVTWAYRMLASFYAQAGAVEKATASLAVLQRHNRGITIQKLTHSIQPSMPIHTPPYPY